MEKQIKGLEDLLLDNDYFNLWCDDLGALIISEKIISKGSISEIVKNKILLTEVNFYESLCSDLELKRERVKLKAAREFKLKHKAGYIETGFLLSSINHRLKKYNIERNKAYQRNEFNKLRKYLISNGFEHLIENSKNESEVSNG